MVVFQIFTDIYSVEENSANYVATIQGAKLDRLGSPIAQFSQEGSYFCNVNVCSQGSCFTVYSTKANSWNCIQVKLTVYNYNITN